MEQIITYIAKTGQNIDLNHVSQKLRLCAPPKGDKVCGMYENFHITLFRDGEIWVDIAGSSEQSRHLMRVASFLAEIFSEQSIEIDFTNLLINARTIHSTVSPSMIIHSNTQSARKQLGSGINVNLFRLLIHSLMFNELGERWKQTIKQFGIDLGCLVYASMADSITEEQSGIENLKKFMQKNGIGLMNQITPISGENLRVMIDESVTCSGIPNMGKRLCYFESGIIEGFFTNLYQKKVTCEEEKCWALGSDHCEFSIKVEQ